MSKTLFGCSAAFAASAIAARSTAKACCQSNADTKHRWLRPRDLRFSSPVPVPAIGRERAHA